MPDEQDRAEAFDDDKAAFESDEPIGIDVLDQTADADPGAADTGAAAIDERESGNDLDGTAEEADDPDDDPYHREAPAPEVAAMHLTDEP